MEVDIRVNNMESDLREVWKVLVRCTSSMASIDADTNIKNNGPNMFIAVSDKIFYFLLG